MKKYIYLSIFIFLIGSCNPKNYVQKDYYETHFIVNPQETTYECNHENIGTTPFLGFVLYNSDVKSPQKGIFSVSITFDSIHNENDLIHISSVKPEWIRIKDLKSDSILVNQSLSKGITDTILIRYQAELLSEIENCNCHATYFNEDFIPLIIGYHFRFTILPDSVTLR